MPMPRSTTPRKVGHTDWVPALDCARARCPPGTPGHAGAPERTTVWLASGSSDRSCAPGAAHASACLHTCERLPVGERGGPGLTTARLGAEPCACGSCLLPLPPRGRPGPSARVSCSPRSMATGSQLSRFRPTSDSSPPRAGTAPCVCGRSRAASCATLCQALASPSPLERNVFRVPTCFSMRPLDTLMLKLRDSRPDESGETHARTQNLHPHGPYAPNPHRASLVTCRRFIPPAVKASRGRQIAFSPDSRWIVSGGDPAAIQLWDAFSGALIRTLQGHTNLVR